VSATASLPADWTEATPDVVKDLKNDPEVTNVVGAWSIGDSNVSVVGIANSASETDPDAYFDARFGTLGKADGLEVSHEASTTSSGLPMLIVDVTPTAGQGGDAQTTFFVFAPTTIVTGVITYAGGIDNDQREALVRIAESTEIS
jgi:hypothetical protein